MWVTTLNMALGILVLVLMLAVLGYIGYAARKFDASLSALLDDQGQRLRKIERDLERVRQALDSVSTGVMAIDIRQRINKKQDSGSQSASERGANHDRALSGSGKRH